MSNIVLLCCLGLSWPCVLGDSLPFIIGGTDVEDATKYPWQCSLQNYFSHYCGASVISDTWLVTAAHCVEDSTGLYDVICGTASWANGGQNKQIEKIIKHEDYEDGPGTFPNDIAVIKLKTALRLGETVKPITMWSASSDGDPAGKECYITGWGYTETGGGGKIASQLQEARINAYTQEECKREWGSNINEGHVCVGDTQNGRGSCNGDSGGPLVCKAGDQLKLVGATSWGINGCFTSYPSVYSRISYFSSWIKSKTGL